MAPQAVIKRLWLEFNDQRIAFLNGRFEPVKALVWLIEDKVNPSDHERGAVSGCKFDEPLAQVRVSLMIAD